MELIEPTLIIIFLFNVLRPLLIKESGKYRITHLKIEIKHLLTFMMNIVPAPR